MSERRLSQLVIALARGLSRAKFRRFDPILYLYFFLSVPFTRTLPVSSLILSISPTHRSIAYGDGQSKDNKTSLLKGIKNIHQLFLFLSMVGVALSVNAPN